MDFFWSSKFCSSSAEKTKQNRGIRISPIRLLPFKHEEKKKPRQHLLLTFPANFNGFTLFSPSASKLSTRLYLTLESHGCRADDSDEQVRSRDQQQRTRKASRVDVSVPCLSDSREETSRKWCENALSGAFKSHLSRCTIIFITLLNT